MFIERYFECEVLCKDDCKEVANVCNEVKVDIFERKV